jgi:aryl-alcohol dehydrogenase-like predicted oxidoreductase
MESCENSLRRLQTDYVDLYQAHRYDYETPLEETLRAFDDLIRQGKVLYIGVSEWTASQIRDAVRIANDMGFDRIVSNQPQYNMLWRVIETEVVPASEELGIGQIVWSPIAQGVLTGKYKKGTAVPAGSRATDKSGGADFVNDWLREEVLEAVEKLEPIAHDMNLTMSQLAIAWVLSNPNVSAAIVGASRPEQITENAKAAGLTLPEDVLSAIDYALGDLVKTDPALTVSPESRP